MKTLVPQLESAKRPLHKPLSLLLPRGANSTVQRFVQTFQQATVECTTLVKHENACSAVEKCETYFVQTVSLLLPP